ALVLKKAWILAMAWRGCKVSSEWLSPPNYPAWPIKELKRELEKLEADFSDALKGILLEWKGVQLKRLARWFAAKFDEWNQSNSPIFCVGRVQEVESTLGPLRAERPMEFPPYAEILLQGFESMAVRHPEYHLARDLVLLHSLFRDAEVFVETSLKDRR